MINCILAGFSLVLFMCFGVANSYALPTFDAGVVSTKIQSVKTSIESYKTTVSTTLGVDKLNTIVGDAQGTMSKYKDTVGKDVEKFQKDFDAAKERASSAIDEANKYKDEVADRTAEYQGALDSVSDEATQALSKASGAVADANDAVGGNATLGNLGKGLDNLNKGVGKGADVLSDVQKKTDALRKNINSDDKSYGDTATYDALDAAQFVEEPVDFHALADGSSSGGSATETEDAAAADKPVSSKEQSQPLMNGSMDMPRPAIVAPIGATIKPLEIQPFRISPTKAIAPAPKLKVMRDSSSRYENTQTIAFAAQGANPYVNNMFVLPMASRCEISAEEFIEDKDKATKCIDKIVKENSAANQFEAASAAKDCNKMVFNTVKALLAEAINAKYEAANYQQVLDKQDEVAANSSDVRNDNHTIAAAFQEGQILLNRSSAVLSSQLILDTVRQLCSMQDEVMENKDETANGEK